MVLWQQVGNYEKATIMHAHMHTVMHPELLLMHIALNTFYSKSLPSLCMGPLECRDDETPTAKEHGHKTEYLLELAGASRLVPWKGHERDSPCPLSM